MWNLNHILTEEIDDPDFRYRGPGDRIFAMVFRRVYGEEIETVSAEAVEDDFKRQLDFARRQPSCRLPDAERLNHRECYS